MGAAYCLRPGGGGLCPESGGLSVRRFAFLGSARLCPRGHRPDDPRHDGQGLSGSYRQKCICSTCCSDLDVPAAYWSGAVEGVCAVAGSRLLRSLGRSVPAELDLGVCAVLADLYPDAVDTPGRWQAGLAEKLSERVVL